MEKQEINCVGEREARITVWVGMKEKDMRKGKEDRK